jgi:MSHA pilin protein MshC
MRMSICVGFQRATWHRCLRRVPTQAGFTMVELITVMILIGILGALAAPRFFDRKSFEARTFTDQTQTMLRYAQKLAIAQNRPVYVRLDGASIALCFNYPGDVMAPNCSTANLVLPPAGVNSGSSSTKIACNNLSAWFCEGLPTGISYVLSQPGPALPAVFYFYFDPLGKPFASADLTPALSSTFPAQLRISISGDGATRDVIVESETGYVH